MRISDAAFDFIVAQEVTSKGYYEAHYRRPEWPGESSGVTVGIGYDLGQTPRDVVAMDWRGRVSDAMLSAMLSACGVIGQAAQPRAAALRMIIDIPWDTALAVHRDCVIPRWEKKVADALPNTDKLSPDCFGALVSLTFNRGPSFSSAGDRYREMRAIKAHMAAGAFDQIPDEIRAMKRLWIGRGVDGLLARRDAEAELFERWLASGQPQAAQPPRPAPAAGAPAAAQADLARRITAAMERKGYRLDRGSGEVNIVYVEGLSPNGTANNNADNEWNDLRLVIRFDDGQPKIAGSWVATTGPGRYYVNNPINPAGAARIEFGQYRAWQVGIHRNDHEALVQTGGAVTVCRDLNEDGERTGDKRDTGDFGINQHWGYDLAHVDKASAGCLVGQSRAGHREFMAIVKSDPRYKADPEFVFATAILAADDLTALPLARSPASNTGKIIVAAGAGATAAGGAAAGAVHAMGGFPTWLVVIVGIAAATIVVGAFWLRQRLRRT